MDVTLFDNARFRQVLEFAVATSLVGLVAVIVFSAVVESGISAEAPRWMALLVMLVIFLVLASNVFVTCMTLLHVGFATRSSLEVKVAWALLILLIPTLGALVYYFARMTPRRKVYRF